LSSGLADRLEGFSGNTDWSRIGARRRHEKTQPRSRKVNRGNIYVQRPKIRSIRRRANVVSQSHANKWLACYLGCAVGGNRDDSEEKWQHVPTRFGRIHEPLRRLQGVGSVGRRARRKSIHLFHQNRAFPSRSI